MGTRAIQKGVLNVPPDRERERGREGEREERERERERERESHLAQATT